MAIVHCHSPEVIPFSASSVPLRPVSHMAAFLGEGVPVFEIRDGDGMTDMLVTIPSWGGRWRNAGEASGADARTRRGGGG